jgi:hypothetical protein
MPRLPDLVLGEPRPDVRVGYHSRRDEDGG